MDLPRLPERPTAEVLTVETILARARAGSIRVPRFQTGLRWTGKHVVDLFDSIVRGFPVGSLLLWKHKSEGGDQEFGPVTVRAPPLPDAMHLVDGQQRVTALVGAMLHPDHPPLGGDHAVWADLVNGSFAVHRSDPGPTWLPLNILGDRVRLLQWSRNLRAGDQTDRLVNRAFELHATLMSYQLPAYVVVNEDPEPLKLIFKRVNFAGVPLTDAQVFESLFGDDANNRPLTQLATSLAADTRFGVLDEDWLLRCVKAVGGLRPRDGFDEAAPPPPELVAQTRQALKRACSLLHVDAGFAHSSVLPYRGPLIVLARFFHRHPAPDPRSRTLLVRWLWRGALSGAHSNTSHAVLGAQLLDIDADEAASVQRLLDRVPTSWALPDPLSRWSGHAAVTRLFAAILVQRILDRDLVDPVTLLSRLDARQLGEVFAPLHRILGPSVAARTWGPTPVSIEDLEPELLEALFISPEMVELLLEGDADKFLQARAHRMKKGLADAVALYAAPTENDRPAIRTLMDRAS